MHYQHEHGGVILQKKVPSCKTIEKHPHNIIFSPTAQTAKTEDNVNLIINLGHGHKFQDF